VPAYILWFGPTGLTFGRALARAGVPVVACHHDTNEPAAGTRLAQVQILPPLEADEQAWLDFLLEEGRGFAPAKAALIAASDAHWLFVVRHRLALAEHFHFALPAGDNLAQWMEKPFQYAAAERAGVPYPRTITPLDLEEVRAAARTLAFPCLVKPVLSHLWQRRYGTKLAFTRNETELVDHSRDAIEHGLAFMIQEYIPAEDHEIYGLHCCVDHESRPLGMCVARKIRQHEPRFGNSCMSVCVDEPRVADLSLRLMREMRFHGIGSAEFKRDPRDGEFKLMEFNVRPTLLMAVGYDSGVNIPLLAYRHLCGEPPPPQPVTPKRFGRRVGIFANDLVTARFYRQMGALSRWQWMRSWLRTRDVHFAWDDLPPFYGYLWTMIDHWQRGKLRGFPANFPTIEQWRALQWDGTTAPRAAGSTPVALMPHASATG
jgi:predicted ATP-grasp superfamily ATP-dependent carboligase